LQQLEILPEMALRGLDAPLHLVQRRITTVGFGEIGGGVRASEFSLPKLRFDLVQAPQSPIGGNQRVH